MNSKHATVKDIALRAGVSIGTVDRVIHDRGMVSPETKARVEGIIVSLGYKPNVLARHLSLNRNYLLRVLLPRSDQDSGYWRICRHGIEAAMAEQSAYNAMLKIDEFDRNDRSAFRALLKDVAAEPGDGLLFAPVLPEDLLPMLDGLGTDLPYVFFDGSLPGARPFASIGQDALRAGRLAGRVMSLLSPGPGPIVAINAHAEDRHIGLRIEGFRSYFTQLAKNTRQKGPEIIVLDCFDIEDAETREGFLSGLFVSRPDIGGILVANASGHLVGEWLVESGRKTGCKLISWDLVPSNAAGLRSGSIDCLISQRPFEQGRMGLLYLLRAVVQDVASPGRLDLPIELWFKENLPSDDGE